MYRYSRRLHKETYNQNFIRNIILVYKNSAEETLMIPGCKKYDGNAHGDVIRYRAANKRGLAPNNSRLPTDVSIRLGWRAGYRVCFARTT